MRRSDMAPQRLINYTTFDKPSQIDSYEVGGPGSSTKYGYGPAREMAYRLDIPVFAGNVNAASVEVQHFGGVELELRKVSTGITKETYKRNVGGVMQIVEERTVNESTFTLTVANATIKTEVLLKDHLGSTHVIVNSDGTDPQYQRFDVWGMRADAGTGATQSVAQAFQSNNPNDATKTRTRKGFTGHEMVDGAGIVHMQGRIYDPRLGRFLQADPVIQDPLNAQNYNRYTYVYNNPLSLTDPSGYRSLSANLELYWKPVATIVVFIVTQQYAAAAKTAAAALAYTVAGGAVAGLINTGTLRGTVMGAVDALLTFGIGQNITNPYALIAAHSLKGGMLEAMNGGDFGHGFVTAGLSKAVGMGVDKLAVGDPMKIIVQALAGGTVSAATGGDFANGAISAALQFAFNQALSDVFKEMISRAGTGMPVTGDDAADIVAKNIKGVAAHCARESCFELSQSLQIVGDGIATSVPAGAIGGAYSFVKGNVRAVRQVGRHVGGALGIEYFSDAQLEIELLDLATKQFFTNPSVRREVYGILSEKAKSVDFDDYNVGYAFGRVGMGFRFSPLGISASAGDGFAAVENAVQTGRTSSAEIAAEFLEKSVSGN